MNAWFARLWCALASSSLLIGQCLAGPTCKLAESSRPRRAVDMDDATAHRRDTAADATEHERHKRPHDLSPTSSIDGARSVLTPEVLWSSRSWPSSRAA
jgi:hypothetical protein